MFAPIRTWALLLALFATTALPAVSLGFLTGVYGITNTSATNTAAGQNQIWLDVTSPQPNQVLFTLGNTGSVTSTITQIYFEQGPLSSIAQIANSGVDFAQVSPGVLPGGNGKPISFATTFETDADNPRPKNGVNNGPAGGDTVGVLFNLASGRTLEDVLSQLESGQFRIGMHVQNFSNGGSESFMVHTPEPATAAMFLAALGLLRVRRRQAAD